MSAPDYHIASIKSHTFRLRFLPEATFLMGSNNTKDAFFMKEHPIHPVKLSPFYMAEYPVTQLLWQLVMGKEPEELYFKGDLRPVEGVSCYDIMGHPEEGTKGFLHFLNQQTQATRPKGYRYQLPTEAQWEYAARAGKNYTYSGGDKLKEVGWYRFNSHAETKTVGQKQPNDFGLYDMSGNVWEWCRDWASNDYYQECFDKGVVENPMGPKSGPTRVLRGGSWAHYPRSCRLASRVNDHPSYRAGDFGFRLVLSPQ